MGKWLWRFGLERESLMRQVVEVKSGSMEGGWWTKPSNGPYGVSPWKYIQWGWAKFSTFIKFEVGDGTRVKFWLDVWCGDMSLKESFPKLYHIASNRGTFVADHMRQRNNSTFWDMNFIWAVQDWELESLSIFLDTLYSGKAAGVGVDKLCWKPSCQKDFEVRSNHKSLTPSQGNRFPWRSIWKPKVPSKVYFFIWVAS